MAMFGSGFRPSMAVSPMDLPPGSPAPAGTMQPAPVAAPAAPKRRGLFGRIGNALFSNPDVLVNLGANIMAASGAPLGQAILGTQQQAREAEEQEFQNLYRAALAKKALEPDARFETVSGPDGKPYAQRNTVTGEMKPLPGREPTSWQERVIARLMDPATPQAEKDILRPMLSGFQYTEPGMAAAAKLTGRLTSARVAATPPKAAAPKPPVGFILDQ